MKRIVVLTESDLIGTGFEAMMKDSKRYQISDVCSRWEQVGETVRRHRADILIATPNLVEMRTGWRESVIGENVAVVALIYNYYEQSVLRQFDGLIEISDGRNKIMDILTKVEARRRHEKDRAMDTDVRSEGLSDREKEVLVLIATGASNKEVASRLNISIYTVISHRRNIVEKTGIKSVAGLTVYALMNNLIEEKDIL